MRLHQLTIQVIQPERVLSLRQQIVGSVWYAQPRSLSQPDLPHGSAARVASQPNFRRRFGAGHNAQIAG